MADEIATIISSIGLSQEAFLVIVLFAVVVVGAIIVIIATRPILDIYPYLHPNARVRARKGQILDEKQFTEIMEANDVDEIKNYLRGFPTIAEDLDKYSIEKALDIRMGSAYDFVSSIAPKDVKSSFKTIAKKSDVDNIKTLLTAKEVGLNKEETVDLLIPTGSLYEDIERLADVSSVSDVVAGLDGTEYASVLEDALPDYENAKMVLPLESALDKNYLEKLLASSETPSDENKQILYAFIGNKVDVANLKLILRAKADGLNFDDISSYMLKDGYQLREWKLKDLMEAESVPGVISSLEGTKYSPVLSEILPEYNETGSVALFEKALDKFLVDSAKSYSMKKPLGIGPIIGFLSQKEVEIKNLKVIVRAKREADFPVSKIREMLV